MIIAANGVREAQMVHILKDIFFFLSAVAVIFCLSSDVQIRAVYRPKQIYRQRGAGEGEKEESREGGEED
jgi:hypothetical protein